MLLDFAGLCRPYCPASSPHRRKTRPFPGTKAKSGKRRTVCWRRESGANPSLKWGFRHLGTTEIPRPLWAIIEAEKGYFGLENGGVSVFAPWQLPRYLDPKLLITLSFSPSRVLAGGEFTVYKRDRTTALSAHPAKNFILFSHLEGQGTYTNLPR